MGKLKITRFDFTNSVDSAPTISMDIMVCGGITHADVSNLRRLIEDDENHDWGRIYVNPGRLNGKIKYFYDWERYTLTTTDRFEIKKVIFNSPATIVYWADGTKTVVQCQDGDEFDPETGIAMCFMKKALGNKSNFNNTFKKWIPETEDIPVKPLSGRYKWNSDGKNKTHKKTFKHLDTEFIYRLLREHKWTVKELAEYTGVHVTSVYSWLRGKGITKRTLSKLSKVLHVHVDDLIKEND